MCAESHLARFASFVLFGLLVFRCYVPTVSEGLNDLYMNGTRVLPCCSHDMAHPLEYLEVGE